MLLKCKIVLKDWERKTKCFHKNFYLRLSFLVTDPSFSRSLYASVENLWSSYLSCCFFHFRRFSNIRPYLSSFKSPREEWHQQHGWIRHLLLYSAPPKTIWHPATYKSVFVGAMRSSTICQGNWEQSWSPVHQEIGIPTSVSDADPAVAHEMTSTPLGYNLGLLGEHCLRQSPMDERTFVEAHVSSEEVPLHHWSKIYKFGSIGEGKRNNLTLLLSPLPLAQLSARWDLLVPWFLLQGKVRACEWILGTSSAAWDHKKEPSSNSGAEGHYEWNEKNAVESIDKKMNPAEDILCELEDKNLKLYSQRKTK